MSAKGKIVNTTPRNFLRDRIFRYVKVVRAGGSTKDPGTFKASRRALKPLLGATGPGSINADSEMLQLINAGRGEEALKYFEAHKDATHKGGAWQHSRVLLWYRLAKAGDDRALGFGS